MVICTRIRKADKPLEAVAVTSHWLTLPTTADMASQVAIEDAKAATFYRLTAHLDQQSGEIMGYRLTKVDGTTYDLDPTGTWGWTCDCPDGLHRANRPGGCRHAVAAQQLLSSLDDALAAAEQERLEAEQADDRAAGCPWCGNPSGPCFPACLEAREGIADEVLADEREADRLHAASVADADRSGAWFDTADYLLGAGV